MLVLTWQIALHTKLYLPFSTKDSIYKCTYDSTKGLSLKVFSQVSCWQTQRPVFCVCTCCSGKAQGKRAHKQYVLLCESIVWNTLFATIVFNGLVGFIRVTFRKYCSQRFEWNHIICVERRVHHSPAAVRFARQRTIQAYAAFDDPDRRFIKCIDDSLDSCFSASSNPHNFQIPPIKHISL
jgi:hypothetical protein